MAANDPGMNATRPKIVVGGNEDVDLTQGLLRMQLRETIQGLMRAELRAHETLDRLAQLHAQKSLRQIDVFVTADDDLRTSGVHSWVVCCHVSRPTASWRDGSPAAI